MSSGAPAMPTRIVKTPVLNVGYHDLGEGIPVVLLHGFPYDIHAFAEVGPILADKGFRIVVPYLRGHGPTHFRDESTPRSAEQGALARDVIDVLDGLGFE